MAIAPLIVAVRTTGSNSLRGLGQDFQRLRTQVRVASRSFSARGGIVGAVQRMGPALQQAGRTAVSGLVSTIQGGFSALPSEVKGAVVAAGAAIGIALSAAIGAALQAALLVGIGGGALAAGIAIAVRDPGVKAAFGGLAETVKESLELAAAPMVGPLIRAAGIVKAAWASTLEPGIASAFAKLSVTIEPLTAGLIGFARAAGPGLAKALGTAVPVLLELAALLPKVGRGFGHFFDSVGSSKQGALKGLRLLVAVVVGALMTLGDTVEGLSKIFDFATKWGEKYAAMLGKIPILGAGAAKVAELLGGLNNETEGTSGYLGTLGAKFDDTGASAGYAAEQLGRLNSKMSDMFEKMTGSLDAAIAYEQAVDDLTESFKENGKSLDIGTQKGRDNVQAIEAVARAAYAAREAAIAHAEGTDQEAAATKAANAAFAQAVTGLEAQLRALGLTQTQIDAVLGSWKALASAPNITKTVTVKEISPGSRGGRGPGLIQFYATGTESARPGLAVVGEHGPELVRMRGGEQVTDATRTAAMLGRTGGGGGSGGSGGGVTRVELVSSGGPRSSSDWLTRALEDAINDGRLRLRTRAGDAVVAG